MSYAEWDDGGGNGLFGLSFGTVCGGMTVNLRRSELFGLSSSSESRDISSLYAVMHLV